MKAIKTALGLTSALFVGMSAVALHAKPKIVYDDEPSQKNPMEGKRVLFVPDPSEPANADGEHGHLEVIGESHLATSPYQTYVKRALDVALSFGGLVILSPIYAAVSAAIYLDDPGPVLFTQKRVGLNKRYFKLHKFRSMRMNTPHDVPTHMLNNPDEYITKVGRVLRKTSLDELPQIWDIFAGNMSIIGPRPALWNQDVLVAYRDECGANDVRPGLTGWAQINGRDELAISEKVRLDGEYVEQLSAGAIHAFLFDCRCFFGTVISVLMADGVSEGFTGMNDDAVNS